MKNLNKDIFREIFNSKTRFLSLFLITLLGVSTFIVLNILSFDMQETINKLYKEYNVADIKLLSTVTFDNNSLKDLSKIDYIDYFEQGYNKEYFLRDSHKVFNLFSIPKKISKIKLIEGKYPKSVAEILIEYKFKDKYNIGDLIYLDNNKTFKITGYFENPINRLVDSSEIAFNSYSISEIVAYTIDEYFNDTEPNFINLKLKNTEELKIYSKRYKEYINTQKTKFENFIYSNEDNYTNVFINKKLKELYDANQKIKDGYTKLKDQENLLLNSKEKISVSKIQLNDKKTEFINAPNKFKDGENKIQTSKLLINELNNQINQGLSLIKSKKNEILKNELNIKDGEEKINTGFESLNKTQNELISKKNDLEDKLKYVNSLKSGIFLSQKTINDNRTKILNGLDEIDKGLKKIDDEKENLNIKIQEINDSKNLIEEAKKNIKIKEDELINKKNELFTGNFELINSKKKLEQEKNKYYLEYNINNKKILDSENKIRESETKINKGLEEFNNKKSDVLSELKENETKISENINILKNTKPIYLINTIFDNSSYISFTDSTDSLNIISKIFPIIFFLIVILVTNTTMTRMINEERNIIGTYLFLGYEAKNILLKYLIYALVPISLGLFWGILIGIYILPKVIYVGFKAGSITLFDNLYIGYNLTHILIVIVFILLSSILSVYLTLKNEINTEISSLLKPKVPNENGKEILLEKLSFFWNKLNFINKITIRNIFRYKGRMLMNLLGIIGCSSLIFLGFAIKNSFSEIPNIQFENIRTFDGEINFKEYLKIDDLVNIKNALSKKYDILDVEIKTLKFKNNETVIAYIFDTDDISKFINIYDINNNKISINDKGIVITDRLVKKYKHNIGDILEFTDLYYDSFKFKIEYIAQNYFSNYIYMNKNYYEISTNKKYKPKSLLIKGDNINYENILNNNKIQNISINSSYRLIFEKISNSLNFIVLFIISLAGLISIVVTYSLLEINVSERKRELATIKVLGFYEKEVSLYIYREIILITFVGIFLGYIMGNIFHKIILKSMEQTNVVFVDKVGYSPYLYSFILTLIFSIISMSLIHRKLKKINMVESLKME